MAYLILRVKKLVYTLRLWKCNMQWKKMPWKVIWTKHNPSFYFASYVYLWCTCVYPRSVLFERGGFFTLSKKTTWRSTIPGWQLKKTICWQRFNINNNQCPQKGRNQEEARCEDTTVTVQFPRLPENACLKNVVQTWWMCYHACWTIMCHKQWWCLSIRCYEHPVKCQLINPVGVG